MRAKRTHQMSINETFAEHEIGQELKAISGWLDQHLDVLDWAEKDIQRKGIKETGRSGMSIEAILRSGLLNTGSGPTRNWRFT
jgi:IS5 family transposase